jgi:hypothetical protein
MIVMTITVAGWYKFWKKRRFETCEFGHPAILDFTTRLSGVNLCRLHTC